jgi:type IV pilus assembly protein PilX
MIASRRDQGGVALVVSLILLVLATLIGLASVRGTNLQERMSANMYDRSLAFQRAESALRAAEEAILLNGRIIDLGGVDCSVAAAVSCPVIPEDTFTGTSANWIAVDDEHNVNDAKAPGAPEYFIQFMGTGSSENSVGLDANADYASYGNTSSAADNLAFYRITARSSSPADAQDRSIVVLQATVKRAL